MVGRDCKNCNVAYAHRQAAAPFGGLEAANLLQSVSTSCYMPTFLVLVYITLFPKANENFCVPWNEKESQFPLTPQECEDLLNFLVELPDECPALSNNVRRKLRSLRPVLRDFKSNVDRGSGKTVNDWFNMATDLDIHDTLEVMSQVF